MASSASPACASPLRFLDPSSHGPALDVLLAERFGIARASEKVRGWLLGRRVACWMGWRDGGGRRDEATPANSHTCALKTQKPGDGAARGVCVQVRARRGALLRQANMCGAVG